MDLAATVYVDASNGYNSDTNRCVFIVGLSSVMMSHRCLPLHYFSHIFLSVKMFFLIVLKTTKIVFDLYHFNKYYVNLFSIIIYIIFIFS